MDDEILMRMMQPLIKLYLSLFHDNHTFYIISIIKLKLFVKLSSQLDKNIPQGQTIVPTWHTDT